MSVRKAFEDAWEVKFPEVPVPTYLSFLDDEGVSSLGAALDSADRTIKQLQQELAHQQFIHDFVLQQLNLSLAARSDYASLPKVASSQRRTVTNDPRKTPVSKMLSAHRASLGQSTRAHGKASQLAAVMAKIGFGRVNRPAVDPEDEGRAHSLEDICDGKKATPLSRFYDQSNMYRASSEPSLVGCGRKYKPQPAIPSTSNSHMPPGFKPVFTKDEHANLSSSVSAHPTENTYYRLGSSAVPLRNSTGTDLNNGQRQRMEEVMASAEMYSDTDLDCVIPPTSTPTLSLQPFDRLKQDLYDGAGPMRPQRPHSHIYAEPKEYQREIPIYITETEVDEDDTSDEEPIYFNIMQYEQQTLSCANAMYTNGAASMTSAGSSENEKSASEQRRLRRMAHHYEHIDPQLTRPMSLVPAGTDSGK